jgi:hypothetical protein
MHTQRLAQAHLQALGGAVATGSVEQRQGARIWRVGVEGIAMYKRGELGIAGSTWPMCPGALQAERRHHVR